MSPFHGLYHYDTCNRLIEADDAGTGILLQALYNARARRLATYDAGGMRTYFRYDGGTRFQELQLQGIAFTPTITTELNRAGGLGGGIGPILSTTRR